MRIKSLIVVVLLAMASLSVAAQAQTRTGTLTDGQQALGPSPTNSVDQPQPAVITVGWNYGHPIACQPLFDGTSHWLYVFLNEGPIIGTSIPTEINALLPACQSGNLIGFYVTATNGSTFSWSNVLLFAYK